MYKVLIVDDEVLVRVGLKTMIDWEAIGFTIVAEAANGEQGYEQYLKHLPDVIITDIKMPKHDGLWLVEKVRSENDGVRMLVLTCYDEFSFARKALKAGADDYILKSEVEDEELVKIMDTLKSKLDAQNKSKENHDHVLANRDDLRKAIVSDLIKKEFNMSEKLMERLQQIEFQVRETTFVFVNVSIQYNQEHLEVAQANNAIVHILFDQLNQREMNYLDAQQSNKYLLLISSPNLNTTELKRIFTAVSNGAKQYFDISLNIVISKVFKDINETGAAYKVFLEKAQILFYKNENAYFIASSDSVSFKEPNVFDLKKERNKNIIEAIGQERLEKSKELLGEVGHFFETENVNPMIVKIFFSNLMGDIFSSYGLFLDNKERFESHNFYHYQIEHSEQLEQIIQLLIEFIIRVIDELQNARHNNSKLMINRALNFIGYHFEEKISLEDVSRELNVSKHYLCNIFKKETGENMSLYINKLRIEKAKQILLESDDKIKEIFEKVGYSNQQYFSKVFKKITGMTINEYKESVVKK